jgi:hypothetical protein
MSMSPTQNGGPLSIAICRSARRAGRRASLETSRAAA